MAELVMAGDIPMPFIATLEPAPAEEAKAPEPKVEVASEPKAPEPAAEAAPVAKPALLDRGSQFKSNLEAERRLREREAVVKSQEAKLSRQAELDALKERDQLAWMQEQGLSYDELTKQVLAGRKPDPNAKLLTKMAELEAKLAARDVAEAKAQEDAQQYQRYQDAVGYIAGVVEKSGRHELVHTMEASGMVLQRIQTHFDETGEQLSEEAAADAVEAYLESLADKFLKANKVKAKMAPPAPVMVVPPAKKSPATLTNRLAAEVSTRIDEPDISTLSEDEQYARMMAELKFK